MTEKTAFIWDLDGTLLDSYDAILAGIEETYQHFQLPFEREAIRRYILESSVQRLITEVCEQTGLDVEQVSRFRAQSLREKNAQVQLMEGAKEVLAWTQDQGIQNFIYTHKGNNAFTILNDLGIAPYFVEVLTGESGFARKPNPEAIDYLLEKYSLEKSQTYYIGDRLLDVETAQAAGIHSINLMIDQQADNQKIEKLIDIFQLI